MLSSTSWICCVTLRLVRRLTANCLWRIAMTLVVRRCSGVRASAPVVMQSGVAGFEHVSVGCVSRFLVRTLRACMRSGFRIVVLRSVRQRLLRERRRLWPRATSATGGRQFSSGLIGGPTAAT